MLHRDKFRAAVDDALRKAIEEDNLDFPRLLADVRRIWSKILDDEGQEAVLDSYKFSLGIR